MNIFTQPSEPETKDGIWIKTNTKYNYEKVQIVQNIETKNTTYTKMDDIPYGLRDGSAVTIGTDIFILGGWKYNTDMNKYNYKINVDTSFNKTLFIVTKNNTFNVLLNKYTYLHFSKAKIYDDLEL